MGKMKWGGYCPDNMSWNSGRLKKGLCTEWQHHLYMSWYNHGKFIHGYGNNPSYRGILFANCFYDFRCFYNVVKNDPLFPQFVKNHELYDIDKDSLYKEWTPRSIRIVTASQNAHIMHVQNPMSAINSRNNMRMAKARHVKAIDPLGNMMIYSSNTECAKCVGIAQTSVSQVCRGKHMISRGPWKGWSFEYL